MVETTVRIVVTTKNAEATICNCVDSLLDLGCACKIAVIDGGSPDGTIEMLKKYGSKLDLVTGDFTRSEAYNHALKRFDEDVFALVDADCEVHPAWLHNLTHSLSADVGIFGGWFTTSKNTNFLEKLIGIEFYARKRRYNKQYVTRLNTGNMMFYRKVAVNVGGFNERVRANQDCDFSYKMLDAGHKIRYVPEADILHHHRSSWRNYFRQQYCYARDLPTVLLNHKHRISSDTTHPFTMTVQPILLALWFLSTLFLPISHIPFTIISLMLLLLWSYDIAEILRYSWRVRVVERKQLLTVSMGLLPLFTVRAFAWMLGGIRYVVAGLTKFAYVCIHVVC